MNSHLNKKQKHFIVGNQRSFALPLDIRNGTDRGFQFHFKQQNHRYFRAPTVCSKKKTLGKVKVRDQSKKDQKKEENEEKNANKYRC